MRGGCNTRSKDALSERRGRHSAGRVKEDEMPTLWGEWYGDGIGRRRFLRAGALGVAGLAFPAAASGQDGSVPWSEMERHFVPPEEYRDSFGDYRSVLTFDDGSAVKTPQDWSRRREEIRKYWHGVMGTWPPLIDKPGIIYGSK